MLRGKWQLDTYLVDLTSGKVTNVIGVERVSHYNGGLFFMPDGKHLGFTPLINGVSKPYVMDLDGRNKRDVSGKDAGFAYGYSASPDSRLISYHEDYQVYIADADGSNKRHIKTGNPFDFNPRWTLVALRLEARWCAAVVRDATFGSRRTPTYKTDTRPRGNVAALATG
jgi:Tol biopolymer transport system component